MHLPKKVTQILLDGEYGGWKSVSHLSCVSYQKPEKQTFVASLLAVNQIKIPTPALDSFTVSPLQCSLLRMRNIENAMIDGR